MASVLPDLRMVMLGNAGVGKTATANVILGRETFRETETTECELQRGRVDDRNISIIDTPGINSATLSSEQLKTEMRRLFSLSDPGPHVFLLLIRVGNFTEDQRNTVEWIQENFGEEALNFTMLLFTGKENLTNSQWSTFIKETHVQDFKEQFRNRYSVINSKREINPTQISKLLEKIDEMVKQNRGQYYIKAEESDRHGITHTTMNETTEQEKWTEDEQNMMATMFRPVERSISGRTQNSLSIEMTTMGEKTIKTEEEGDRINIRKPSFRFTTRTDQDLGRARESLNRQVENWREEEKERWAAMKGVKHSESDVRIVLVGRSGSGKSSSGNTILGREAFGKALINVSSTERECKIQDGIVENESVSVTDTNGKMQISLFARNNPVVLAHSTFKQCLELCSPGPHVFLLVMRSPNFMWAYETFYPLKCQFGEEFLKRSIVLITHGDIWGRVRRRDLSVSVEKLVDSCGGRYHVFNNENQEDHTQVTELMEKIKTLIEENEKEPYTNEMYLKAQSSETVQSRRCSVS